MIKQVIITTPTGTNVKYQLELQATGLVVKNLDKWIPLSVLCDIKKRTTLGKKRGRVADCPYWFWSVSR